MPWILLLHIIALLVWTAAVLYLPVLIASEARRRTQFVEMSQSMGSVARLVYTHIASPAAIIAIIAGTLVFVVNEILTFWLLVKLTLVAMLVTVHASLGLLITRLEREEMRHLPVFSWLAFAILTFLIVCILWVVLAKPAEPEALPWTL